MLALRDIRIRRGLSQADLSATTGVSEFTISEIEGGKRPNPRPSTLRKLAKGLGVEVADFFVEEPDPKAPTQESAASKAVADFRRFKTGAKRLLNEELESRNLETVAHILDEAYAIRNALLDNVGWSNWEEVRAADRLYRELVELVLAEGLGVRQEVASPASGTQGDLSATHEVEEIVA